METAKNILNIGDIIYATYYGNVMVVFRIERVTSTMAICGGNRFHRECVRDVKRISKGIDVYTYSVETPELKELYFRQEAEKKIKAFDFKKLTTEQINEIMKIIES